VVLDVLVDVVDVLDVEVVVVVADAQVETSMISSPAI
jgi:hypothetical protein